MKDLFNEINVAKLFSPKAAVTDNTAFQSGWIDRRGYQSFTAIIQSGSLADADATFAVTMEHADADDQSDSAAVASTDVLGTLALAGLTFADDDAVRKVGYKGNKRYVRVTVTPSNNSGNAFISGVAILGHPWIAPTPNPPA